MNEKKLSNYTDWIGINSDIERTMNNGWVTWKN
jgi:hypothetical protein